MALETNVGRLAAFDMRSCTRWRAAALVAVLAALYSSGCRTKSAWHKPDPELNRMLEVPRYDIYEAGGFFDDGMTMRKPPEGTVPFGAVTGDSNYLEGRADGVYASTFPLQIDESLITRGRTRFERTCSACHGMSGYGNPMVTRHMERPAPSLHQPRLRELSPGLLFSVVSSGYGFMPGYAAQLDVRDRWAVVAYVKALQLSQHAPVAELPERLRAEIKRRLP